MTRIGVIGCGGMGEGHIKQLQALSPSGEITAVADIDEEKARAASALLGGAKAATDFRDILDDVDAVLLSLPHHLHHSVGMECLRAGKHVLMEKPLANSEQECLDLIAAAEAADRVLMTAYCMRYNPLVVRMKELLDKKAYGEVFSLSLWTEQYTEYPPGHWALSANKLGGGQLFSHGCHYVDLLLWFLGDPVEGVHVGTNYCTPWMEKEGTSHVTMKFRSGALGYHFGTWGAKGTRLSYSFHAHCEKGMIEANFRQGKLIAIVGNDEEVMLECSEVKHLEKEMRHFLDCIETGKTPLTDAPGSLQGLRVIWKLYEAEEQGTIADLRGLGLNALVNA